VLSPLELGIVTCVALLTVLAALWWVGRFAGLAGDNRGVHLEPITLLFDGGVLQHATHHALAKLALQPGLHDWDDLRGLIGQRFPNFPEAASTGQRGKITMFAADESELSQLEIKWRGPLCWVNLSDVGTTENGGTDKETLREIAALRRSNDTSPNPVWHTDQEGQVFWHNPAYANLHELAHGATDDQSAALFRDQDSSRKNRVSLHIEGSDKPDWYALSTIKIDDVSVHHATCINAVVDAEEAQRNFVQTLAKTFAHLSIGLAIFDRNGQLALFNPALVDLTDLPAHFLSARPTMLSFFDQLRESRRMPVPKNYHNWRQEISDVIAAATDGRYEETWSLETGQTYCIKGRPHPDGATAFLIEDISAEIALTRNFRAELELSQSLLDTLDDGLAVFTAAGILTFSNAAYRDLWGHNPEDSFADVTIVDAIALWKQQSSGNPVWPDLQNSIATYNDRSAWEMPLKLNTGRALICQVVPVASGATLIRFRSTPKSAARQLEDTAYATP